MEETRMAKPHVLMIPYPVQGHIIPLMELAQCLAKHGFKITFVNTEITHQRVVNALGGKDVLESDDVLLVSIPDGVETGEDRNVPGKLSEAIYKVMPGKLVELIQGYNASEDDKICCIIADQSLGWAQEVAKKLGIQGVAFLPAAAAVLVLGFSIQKLIDDGIIDQDGETFYRRKLLCPFAIATYPAQGHVMPLMEIALCLVEHGIRVTFVNTDGLASWEDRNDHGKLLEAIFQVMPGKLEALIDNINGSGDDKITCLIADENMGWALEVAEKMGIRGIAFWPAAAALLALQFSLQKLIDGGIIDSMGKPHCI